MALDVFRSRLSVTGGSVRNSFIKSSRILFDNLIDGDPSYHVAEVIRNDIVVGTINLRMDSRKTTANTPQMKIHDDLSSEIKFKLGDVFHTTVVEEGNTKEKYWLCIEENNLHGVERDGAVEECNHYIKWQNINTKEIIGRWCSFRSPYSSGTTSGSTVINEAAKYTIKIPYDDETKFLGIDRRFLIKYQGKLDGSYEPMAWKVIEYNPISSFYSSIDEGFLEMNIRADQYNKDFDDADLMIANFKGFPVPQPEPVGNCEIVPQGNHIVKQGGSPKKFFAKFYNSANLPIEGIVANWSLELPVELQNPDKIVISFENENEIEVKAFADAIVGSKFFIIMTADDNVYGHFEARFECEVGDLW